MLAGASGFLGSSVFSWVRSAKYNRKLYNNIILPTNCVPESELAKAAREKALEPMWERGFDSYAPGFIFRPLPRSEWRR